MGSETEHIPGENLLKLSERGLDVFIIKMYVRR